MDKPYKLHKIKSTNLILIEIEIQKSLNKLRKRVQ